MSKTSTNVSTELALYLADTTTACGLQYGLWVEASPTVEEQIALSSMSQDKLGHARVFHKIAQDATGQSYVELTYERDPEAFAWNPAWCALLESWEHLVLAQVLFSRALMHELRATAEGTKVRSVLAKLEQEENWHTKHGDAWLEAESASGASTRLAAAFEDLWPLAAAYFGAEGQDRFPDDVASGALTQGDDELRAGWLDEVVPILEAAGLKVPASNSDGAWTTEPPATSGRVDEAQAMVEEHALELTALLQDPAGRALAEL